MYKLHVGGFAASLLIASCGALPAFACLPDLFCTVTFSVPGSTGTVPTSINSSGAVAGYYVTASYNFYGFVRDPDGTITTFGGPGGGPICSSSCDSTETVYINDSGVVAGTYKDTSNNYHAFTGNPKVAGGIILIDPPGAWFAEVGGINASGWVVGNYGDSYSGHQRGFLSVAGGTSTPFDFPGAHSTWAYSVDSSNYVVGLYLDHTYKEHGFWCYSACSTFHGLFDLPALFGDDTCLGGPLAANSSLVVAGTFCNRETVYAGDLLAGTSKTFQAPGSFQTASYGINSSGVIVGTYTDTKGSHAYWRTTSGLMVNGDPSGSSGNVSGYAINDAGAFTGTVGALGFITSPETLHCCGPLP